MKNEQARPKQSETMHKIKVTRKDKIAICIAIGGHLMSHQLFWALYVYIILLDPQCISLQIQQFRNLLVAVLHTHKILAQ